MADEAFYRAVVAAGRAPPAVNAQPWRRRATDGVLDLFADHDGTPLGAGAIGRLTTISCGAALRHARLTLAARGWRVTVTRRPDTAETRAIAPRTTRRETAWILDRGRRAEAAADMSRQ